MSIADRVRWIARKPNKLGRPGPGVNFRGAACVALVAGSLLTALQGCGRPIRPAPIDPGSSHAWPTVLGNVQRRGFINELPPDEVEEAWRAEVGRGLVTPLLVDDAVVIASAGNRVIATLSTETGDQYWERRLDGALTGGAIRHGGVVYVPTEGREGRLHAMELRKGGRQWSRDLGSVQFPPSMVGDTLYVGTESGELVALSADQGGVLWRVRLSGAAAATPVPWRESILLPTRADTLFLVNRGTGMVDGRVVLPARTSAAPALAGDTLYLPLFSGDLLALRLPDLEELWRAPFDEPIQAAPIVAPDRSIYLLTRTADVWRVPPGGRAGEKLATLTGAARGSLTLAGDRLLVGRLDGALFQLRTDGTTVWRYDLDDSIVAPVTVRDGAVYVPLLRGTIVKLR